ncbi:MAG: hypothetical protein JWP18_1710 [Solirubrobacterales bacterium]|nr:hypothetical protein [Solirubrobacterales bacterium]
MTHEPRRLRALICTSAVGLALVFAGCGGGDDEKKPASSSASSSATSPANTKSAGPLGEVGESAQTESYVPEGEIVADTGFRAEIDGFGFQNYGNEEDTQNLTPASMEYTFGEQVCARGTGEDCVLKPAAAAWMEQQNEGMAGGHCMGMSVAALRLYAETLDVTDFGVERTNDIPADDADAQQNIAESFIYQSIPSIASTVVRGTPNEILDRVIKEMNDNNDYFTLGIYKRDGSAGHAITPIAVEDAGEGIFNILVWDNNFPDTTRAVEIDTNENTFAYSAAASPDDEESLYDGGEGDGNLDLTGTLEGENIQPCPFCNGDLLGDEAGKGKLGTVLPKEEQYSELTLTGDPENHPHLVLTDTEGNQTGIVDGKIVEDVPGVRMVRRFADDPSLGAPEPSFQIPAGKDINISIDGSALKKKAKSKIDFTGNGIVISIDDIVTRPGQVDNAFVAGGGYGLYYENNGKADETTPLLFAGVDDEDASYTFAATAAGLKKGSSIGLIVDQKSGQVLLDADGANGAYGGKGFFALVIGKSDAKGEYTWVDDDLELRGGKKPEGAYFNWKEQKLTVGKPVKVEVGPEDGPYKVRKARYEP